MSKARIPDNEHDRIAALKRYDILDTETEELFDSISKLAATICEVPIAIISLIDEDRQWFKAAIGTESKGTHRDYAFCAHAILNPDQLLVVSDPTLDERFRDNPLVTGDPNIRFYAGSPIVTKDNQALGTLCVIDTQQHELNEMQREALAHLSKQVTANLELRLAHKKLELLNESKNRFFSILAHDLRSPLQSIVSIAELLNDPDSDFTPNEESEFKSHLLTNSQVTLQTAEGLLQMVQFEEGRFNFQPASLPLLKILNSANDALSGRSFKKNISVDISCDPHLRVWADKSLLQSIAQNLLSNALKFSHPNSEIRISVETFETTTSVTIIDTGTGIKPHVLQKIFDLESSYSTIGTGGELGSGLGLTLCKQFANRLKGDLQLESEYGKGTRAILTLLNKEPAKH